MIFSSTTKFSIQIRAATRFLRSIIIFCLWSRTRRASAESKSNLRSGRAWRLRHFTIGDVTFRTKSKTRENSRQAEIAIGRRAALFELRMKNRLEIALSLGRFPLVASFFESGSADFFPIHRFDLSSREVVCQQRSSAMTSRSVDCATTITRRRPAADDNGITVQKRGSLFYFLLVWGSAKTTQKWQLSPDAEFGVGKLLEPVDYCGSGRFSRFYIERVFELKNCIFFKQIIRKIIYIQFY